MNNLFQRENQVFKLSTDWGKYRPVTPGLAIICRILVIFNASHIDTREIRLITEVTVIYNFTNNKARIRNYCSKCPISSFKCIIFLCDTSEIKQLSGVRKYNFTNN